MAKDTVENTRKIDITWLIRTGKYKDKNFYYNRGITWTTSGVWGESKNSISYDLDLSEKHSSRINLYYTTTDNYSGEKNKLNYWVDLTTTQCHFGGFRYWFVCPASDCHRRVGALYFGQNYFFCRHCLDLSYKARNDSKRFRDLGKLFDYEDKMEKLADKIWGKHGRKFYGGRPTKKYQKYMNYYYLEKASLNNCYNSLVL